MPIRLSPNRHRKPAKGDKTNVSDIFGNLVLLCFLQLTEGAEDAKTVR